VFEFPARLMKEGSPEEHFHNQEERRLFYVALTRAQERLTITSVVEPKGKVPPFVEDLLLDPVVRRRDILQLKPKLAAVATASAAGDGSRAATQQESLFSPRAGNPRVFSRIAEWAETFHPPSPEPLELHPSAVQSYRGCPQRYLFSALWSLQEGPKATLTFGRVMHGTIRRMMAEFKKGNRLPFDEVERIYEAEWSDKGYEDEYQEGEYKKDGLEQLRAFHRWVGGQTLEILQLEKPFELPVENNVILKGRIDQINSLGGNNVEVVDYKTGKPQKQTEARKDLQLSVYAIATREILERNPVRLVFHYLQDNERLESTRDAKQLDETLRIVQEVAADIRAANFPPKVAFACRACAYRPICPAHEEALSS
jgi:DNA helicase II / ATP-dependent DNA helicase PcrA